MNRKSEKKIIQHSPGARVSASLVGRGQDSGQQSPLLLAHLVITPISANKTFTRRMFFLWTLHPLRALEETLSLSTALKTIEEKTLQKIHCKNKVTLTGT